MCCSSSTSSGYAGGAAQIPQANATNDKSFTIAGVSIVSTIVLKKSF
jgi:hypothetical protein